MKWKNICSAGVAILLLLLFVPVFYHMIMYGNNMNYNQAHKIITIEGNRVLLLCALVGTMMFMLLYAGLRKIPYNRYTAKGVVLFTIISCVIFYFINVHISKCIAFYGGWDCGMVANSARWIFEGGELGYDDYYTIYSNNIPITWLLYKLYDWACGLKGYPYNPEFIWIQFQCFLFTIALFCMVMTVLMITKKIAPTIMMLLIGSMVLGLSPWKIVPYTDGNTIAVPILLIFLYTFFCQMQSKGKYIVWFVMILTGFLGGIMKATSYVTLIAVVLVDFLWVLFGKDTLVCKCKKVVFRIVFIVVAFLIAKACKNGMYHTLNYDYDRDMEIGWTNYLYNGLNEETTGACSPEGLAIVREYAGCPLSARTQFEMDGIKTRMKEKGFKGILDFWMRKQVMNYNDGTFSWYQEGYFDAWEYENITDSNWKEPLRSFYWDDGEDYIRFVTWSQGIWLFVLLGVVAEATLLLFQCIMKLMQKKSGSWIKDKENGVRTVGVVAFIGMYLFVMLFEGRARYLYNSVPVFVMMAVLGFSAATEFGCDCMRVFRQRIIRKKDDLGQES